ncbi:hypothetical protein [Xenorhabdus bovienii]|uniref:hypothetical protein n=1 Tax=Xenorhabdus bovienii TaxID=40576 RepID=UPI00237CFC77|nr:hypothetical protein [Xenorhabdus bovienii]MDE1481090.1 hypothetical protein [Xenorhabdus bovienii]MDE9430924.1 hypothetical protein [Xenorhabdus bovienii]MDE9440367.1 hypothetical protein [Xenorhabdus bovienii]MDE9488568.1 hypothetical protein [Xenorhabdus bovienii]MDE9504948.1 hypothetical protein [Xenorhabdus bovienii]
MNILPENSIIVRYMATNSIILAISKNENDLVNKMKLLGFSLISNETRELHYSDVPLYVNFMELLVDNEEDKIKIVKELIKEGALFSYGKEWSPEEVMDYWKKDKGIELEKYKTIGWYGPEKYLIREVE